MLCPTQDRAFCRKMMVRVGLLDGMKTCWKCRIYLVIYQQSSISFFLPFWGYKGLTFYVHHPVRLHEEAKSAI